MLTAVIIGPHAIICCLHYWCISKDEQTPSNTNHYFSLMPFLKFITNQNCSHNTLSVKLRLLLYEFHCKPWLLYLWNMEGWTARNRWIDRYIDEWMNEWIGGWRDRRMDARNLGKCCKQSTSKAVLTIPDKNLTQVSTSHLCFIHCLLSLAKQLLLTSKAVAYQWKSKLYRCHCRRLGIS